MVGGEVGGEGGIPGWGGRRREGGGAQVLMWVWVVCAGAVHRWYVQGGGGGRGLGEGGRRRASVRTTCQQEA